MGHLGYDNYDAPFTYADVIANTSGIKDTLGGKVGAEYADPYGQGRITIIQ